MSAAPAPPPSQDPKKTPGVSATLVAPATGFGAILGGLAVLPILFLILFHSGAAYLSYQKYQSGLWAFVNFLFAYFYYPYYAFFLSGTPAYAEPSPINTMMGGLRKLFKGGRKH
jgi:hypothetical protein